MKVFVTGSSGFIGSFLCEALDKAGHEVYCLTRTIKKFKEYSIKGIPILGELSPHRPNSWIYEVPKDIDVVIHLAGIVHSFKPKDFYLQNAEATRVLISDLKSHNPELRFVLVSSLAASGPSQLNHKKKEEDQELPVSHYGRSKLEAESYLQNLAPSSWTKVVIRPPVVIGPRDPAMLDVFKMVNSGLILISGIDGMRKKYSFVSVYDLVGAIEKIIVRPFQSKWEVFFLAYQRSFTFGELIDEISSLCNRKKVIRFYLPLFLIRFVAWSAYFLAKVFPINFRITPDKTKELSPSAWEVDANKSVLNLEFTYTDDLKSSLKQAFTDYQSRDWL